MFLHCICLICILGWIRNGYDIQDPFVKCRLSIIQFLGKSGFKSGLLFLRNIMFFPNFAFSPCFFVEHLDQNVHTDRGFIFGFFHLPKCMSFAAARTYIITVERGFVVSSARENYKPKSIVVLLWRWAEYARGRERAVEDLSFRKSAFL